MALPEYDINSPVAWKDFKFWPKSAQTEYILGIRRKYHVTVGMIAQMLGIAPSSLSGYCHGTLGLGRLTASPMMSIEDRESWDRFLIGWENPTQVALRKNEIKKERIAMGDQKWHAMRFDEFRQMSIDDQTEFIQYLQDKYHASLKYISQMMGVSESTMSKYCKTSLPEVTFTGYKMSRGQKTKFYEFTGSGNTAVQNAITQASKNGNAEVDRASDSKSKDTEIERIQPMVSKLTKDATTSQVASSDDKKRIRRRNFVFEDSFTSEEILDALVSLIGKGEQFHGRLEINCEMW